MKRLIRNVVLGSMLVAWAGLANAQTNAVSTNAPPKKIAPVAKKMECEIVSVNADAKTIEVKADGKTEKLILSKKCEIMKGGKAAALADLKAGEKCECKVYDRKDGTKSVSHIAIGE